MALPGNLSSVTVIGTFITPEGSASTGSVSFTPSSWLTDSGANLSIPNSAVTKTLGTAGDFSAVLPVTDDPDVTPANWVYSVSEVVDGVSRSYNILLPGTATPGGTVYLADIAPAAAAGPEYYSLASSLSIGTVSTVATGGSATATITGTAPSQILNLGIPVGATGNVASSGSGSVGTAAVYPTGDPDTGIYYPAANQVAITTGGTQALLLSGGAVSNPTFTGQVIVPAGSESAPAIAPTGDANTGLFFPAADTLAVTTGGSERVRVDSTGKLAINTTSADSRIVRLASTAAELLALDRYAASTGQPALDMRKSRGATIGAAGTVTSGDNLGVIRFYGDDGTSFSQAAQVISAVDGTVATGDVPGRVAILTKPSGGTIAERMRIDSNGLITGTGTSLGAWTSYTPTIAGTGWALGNGTMTAAYCRIGKVVQFRISVVWGSTSTYGSGFLSFSTPLNNLAAADNHMIGTVRSYDTSAAKPYIGQVVLYANNLYPYGLISAAGELDGIKAAVPFTWASGDSLYVTGTYETSA